MENTNYNYIISHNENTETYQLWNFDPDSNNPLTAIPLGPEAAIEPGSQLIQIGNFILQWGQLSLDKFYPCYPYRLSILDPTSKDPLNSNVISEGAWPKTKFWGRRADFGNPQGGKKNFDEATHLKLLGFDNYILNWIPTPGRGTFQLWNFDPASNNYGPNGKDPLPDTVSPQGAWGSIQSGHQLIPIGGYMIDWVPETGDYFLWSFDPQGRNPISRPVIQQGNWKNIGQGHQLIAIDNYILDWVPADKTFNLWKFDPTQSNPLGDAPVQSGTLSADFTKDTILTGVQTLIPVDESRKDQPGTIDFMRNQIKHVVYYMVENRSLDHVCGWLYENSNGPMHIIGPEGEYKGANTNFYNIDENGEKVFLSKYKDGKLSNDYLLELLSQDPYHDNSDVLRQLFDDDETDYAERKTPDMGGFVLNNGTPEVMQTYTPEQLPVLNGLAKNFAISDEWFCSMPGGTDVNRAFSLSGSSYGMLNNFQNGVEYEIWPQSTHRPSIWKTLWSNGFKDWKIYNAITWRDFTFTYHLFLDGQIPTVDKNKSEYVNGIDQFYKDAENGTLPAFSYVEPIWIAKTGTTSYHPGADLIPGELELNKIFNALQNSPKWNETLLVITFDEHGGIYDHVQPPYAVNPYPNDSNNEFKFDIMGVRVPTLLVSPWVEKETVFRSETPVAYDATSFLSTLLEWYGIPKSRWGLGERTKASPTFEGAIKSTAARTDKLHITPPYDKEHPKEGEPTAKHPIHDLHKLMLPRLLFHMTKGKLSTAERSMLAEDIIASTDNLESLHIKLKSLHKEHS